jgi:hypothetical protein
MGTFQWCQEDGGGGHDALGDLKLTNQSRKIHKVTLSLGPPFTPTPYFNLKPCYQ